MFPSRASEQTATYVQNGWAHPRYFRPLFGGQSNPTDCAGEAVAGAPGAGLPHHRFGRTRHRRGPARRASVSNLVERSYPV